MKAALKSAACTAEQVPGGFAVCCGAMALETPNGAPLIVPSLALAKVIAEENSFRPGRSDPHQNSFLQLAATAIDIIAKSRAEIIDRILAYAESDLLCHRADHPPELAEEQEKIWQPLLDWCAERFKAPLIAGTGIMPLKQPPESLLALREAVMSCDEFRLAGLSQAVTSSGSLVLGLALAVRHLTGEEACDTAELDAAYQMQDWGEDSAIQARIAAIRRDLIFCEQWFDLLGEK